MNFPTVPNLAVHSKNYKPWSSRLAGRGGSMAPGLLRTWSRNRWRERPRRGRPPRSFRRAWRLPPAWMPMFAGARAAAGNPGACGCHCSAPPHVWVATGRRDVLRLARDRPWAGTAPPPLTRVAGHVGPWLSAAAPRREAERLRSRGTRRPPDATAIPSARPPLPLTSRNGPSGNPTGRHGTSRLGHCAISAGSPGRSIPC